MKQPPSRRPNRPEYYRPDSDNPIVNYAKIVLIVSFGVSCVAAIITASPRTFLGTMVLGVFIGFLVYSGWYD